MLDVGWTELFLVAIVALIVIGPKDLPAALHTFGKYVGYVRRMVRQFQDSIDDIAREEELRELQKTVNDATSTKSIDRFLNSDVDDAGKAAKSSEVPASEVAADSDANTMEPPNRIEPPTGDSPTGAAGVATDAPAEAEPLPKSNPTASS
ncbi:MAG: twin-arginine translocase subunit TatB [Alphaproteobacteria bacterium]|nr:twin-arginine translocase subunit TatB [Alphaproteobacteria bacterium]MCB9930877.1 twin-arginine translocase subunit TatB [Alphaproteobacteria bacterium]